MTKKEIIDIIAEQFKKQYGTIMLEPCPKTRDGAFVKLTKAQKDTLEVCRANDEIAYFQREQQLIAFVLDFVNSVNGTNNKPINTLTFD